MTRIGLLASGNLGKLILEKLLSMPNVEVLFVFTDSASQGILETAQKHAINFFKGNPRAGKANEFLAKQAEPDMILSVNYLFIVEKDVIAKARKYAINIHGSLLPKYRGRTPHVWAIINNESESGITAHFMDEGCDTGDIVEQIRIPIHAEMTGQELLNQFNLRYGHLVERLIEQFESSGSFKTVKQDEAKATYFGKRTPADGLINWHWQKERIHNWIRAQARPYPGAFSFCNGDKLVIHKIRFSELGYSFDMQNGLILQTGEDTLFIKTPNGVVEILDYEAENKNLIIKKGDILNENN